MEQVNREKYVRLIYPALAIVTLIVFGQICRNGFIGYDDPYYITENPHVKGGITPQSIKWAFTTMECANWHPLTWLSHMLDCQLFGVNPPLHHFTSLLFHIANTLLLFWILKKMTGGIWTSAFVAAAFALHPTHVESVAWASERKDVLSGLFWMLTIVCYIRYTEHQSIARYILVPFCFALGLMTKPMLVTLPFVLLLLDYWPLDRLHLNSRKQITIRPFMEKIPLFILSTASSIVTYIAQQSSGAMNYGENYPLNVRLSNAAISYIAYIGKLIYPSRLAILYPYPAENLPLWQTIVSILILIIISAGVIYTVRRYLTVGWFWYIGTLVPVIGIVQVGAQRMADRYTYLPSIGILIMVAWGITDLIARIPRRKIVLSIAAGIVLTSFSICTMLQVRYWQSSTNLYKHAIEVTENNYIIHCFYGTSLSKEGKLTQALKQFDITLQIHPGYRRAYFGIGTVLLKQEKFVEAVEYFEKAISIKPDYHEAYFNMGVAFAKQGETNKAIESWKKTLNIEPDYNSANFNLGIMMTDQGKYEDAIKYFKAALRSKPDRADVYYEMGRAFYLQGNRELAVEQCIKALDIKPDYTEARVTLAHTLAEMDRTQSAIGHYSTALKFEPDNVYALKNMAWLLVITKDVKLYNPGKAVGLAEKACELTDYKDIEALDTLATAYSAAGRFSEAVKILEKAYEVAISSGNKESVERIKKQLDSYKTNKL